MLKTWNMGLIGVGGLNRSQAYVHHPRIRVAAVCDVDGAALERAGDLFSLPDAARFSRLEDMLAAEVDIVVVGTPMRFHADQAVMALEAGKHVLSEVTAADTVDGCMRILDAVRRTRRAYMLAENYVYFDYIRRWKEIAAAGRLGRIFHAEAEYVHEIRRLLVSPETGETFWRHERPPIIYCTHCLGPLLFLMEDRIVRATGLGTTHWTIPGEAPGQVDMHVALFETAKGASIKILRSQVAPRHPEVIHYSLYGTKGCIENGKDGYNTTGRLYLEGEPEYAAGARPIACDPVDHAAPPEALLGGHGTSEYYLIRDFVDALDRGGEMPIDIVRGLEMTLPGLVAAEAIQRGGVWLDVPAVERQ